MKILEEIFSVIGVFCWVLWVHIKFVLTEPRAAIKEIRRLVRRR